MDKKKAEVVAISFLAGTAFGAALVAVSTSSRLEKANETFKTRLNVVSNIYKRLHDLKNDPNVSADEFRQALKEENDFLNLVVNRPVL